MKPSKPRRGRPPLPPGEKLRHVTIPMPEGMIFTLEEKARADGISRSQVVRNWIAYGSAIFAAPRGRAVPADGVLLDEAVETDAG